MKPRHPPIHTRPPRIERAEFSPERRVLAVSDVHGNLPYLKGLLEKVRFSADDILVIAGDLLEKGRYSLDTLRYVTALSKTHEVRLLPGNCDWWIGILYEMNRPDITVGYLCQQPQSLLAQMCAELGVEVRPDMDLYAARDAAAARYKDEFDFLRAAPEILETPEFTFVHGGLPAGDPAGWEAWQCMKYDDFLHCGRRFDKWVITGHWPVVLYRENIVNANPLIDRETRIVSIDGGCVLKDDGQLNALILPGDGEDFTWEYYDPFPTATVLDPQAASERSYYIRWGDAHVRVLDRGPEFSRVRHIRTGYEMDVLTKYLYGDDAECTVNDCTDYVLPLAPGDTVSIVEETSRGYFVKHRGVSGWYFGKLRK